MTSTQIILNPHAASGRAGKLWHDLEPLLRDALGDLVLAVTQTPGEVIKHLHHAYEQNLQRIISIGGDGTNHAVINGLAQLAQQDSKFASIPYGMLPVGTGRDWARSRGIPFDFRKSIEWIQDATPKLTDIGQIIFDDDMQKPTYFLNIASAGLGGEVDARVNRVENRRPWTFLKATVASILAYQPQHVEIIVDGHTWFDDRTLLTVIANGTTFGHGMKIAPDASTYDGLFDIIVIEDLSKIRVLSALGHVYTGTHLSQNGVHHTRGEQVTVISKNGTLALDLDGEYATGEHLTFNVLPGLLQLLA